MIDDQPDPLETLQKYQPHGQPGNVGGGRYPVKTRQEMREIARLLTLANPKVRQRLNKEAENGTMPVPIFIELVRQGYGMPEQKVKVEDGQRARPQLRTLRPIGWDPINPGNPDLKIIEATYGSLPALPAAGDTAGGDQAAGDSAEATPQEPESPAGSTARTAPAGTGKATGRPSQKNAAPSSIVPHPEVVPESVRAKIHRRRPKPPDGDDSVPLRVDGV